MNKRKHSVSGNIFVYILGGIFLLGLLVIIMKGNSQEGAGVESDKTALSIQEMFQYANALERGVQNILRDNTYSEADIRFGHASNVVNYGLITDVPARQVFDPTGGGVEYKATPPALLNSGTQWQFFATTHIPDLGSNTAATSKAELIALLPNITRAACEKINLALKQSINLTSYTDPAGNGCIYDVGNHFTGTYEQGASTNTLDRTLIPNLPARELCVSCSDGTYHYYRVLLAR
jgi:hypothetical protein